MSYYYQDEIRITKIDTGDFGTPTEEASFLSEAYIEDDSAIQYGADGAPIRPAIRVFLPASTDLDEGDFIEVTKRFHESVTEQRRKVRIVSKVGSIKASHLEVVI